MKSPAKLPKSLIIGISQFHLTDSCWLILVGIKSSIRRNPSSIHKKAMEIKTKYAYSQYPSEEEILLPPLTALEVVGTRIEGAVVIVEIRPSMQGG